MFNITVICTRHNELGLCNSHELYKIIERLDPGVIFEEIPPSLFKDYYKIKSRGNMETNAINKYLETHNPKQIPVDSDNIPGDSFFRDHEYMLKRIEGLIDVNGFNYRDFIDRNKMYIAEYGFAYLNSIYSENINDEISDAIEKGLQTINNDKLNQTFKIWKEINEDRENVMLNKIYEYSKENGYDRAIFTVGAAHRKSLRLKVQEKNTKQAPRLSWTFYGYGALNH